jgi:hypothetical protein
LGLVEHPKTLSGGEWDFLTAGDDELTTGDDVLTTGDDVLTTGDDVMSPMMVSTLEMYKGSGSRITQGNLARNGNGFDEFLNVSTPLRYAKG